MKNHQLNHQVQAAQRRLEDLIQRVGEPDTDPQALIQAAVEEVSNDLEEIRATHEQLEAERQRYQELFALAPNAYLVTDAEGMIQEANQTAGQLLGLPPAGLTGQPLFRFVPEGEREKVNAQIRSLKAAEAAQRKHWEVDLQPPEGAPFHAALTVTPVRDEGGELISLRWLMQDVSEARRRRQENRRQRQFLEQLMEMAPVGIAVVRGEDHRFEMANAYYQAIPGAEQPIVGRTFAQVFGQPHFEQSKKVLDEIYRTAAPLHLRERQGAQVPDEGATYWSVGLLPLQDLAGAVNGILIIAQDMSQEVRSRKEIQRLAVDLQREQVKLETIIENTHAQLAYLDPDLNFVHVNTAYADSSGVQREELVGRNHFDLFPDEENRAIFEQAVRTGDPVFFQGRPFVHPDAPERGTTYWNWSLVPVKGGDGKVEGLVLSLLDVTEQMQLMQQLDVERTRLNAIVESSPEAIVVTDEEAQITLTNRAADEIYVRQVPYGAPYERHGELCLCYPDGREYAPRDLPLTRAALDGERYKDLEMLLVEPGGKQRVLLVSTAPIRDSDGEITGGIGIFRDITERKRIEEAVWEYAERIQMLHDLDKAILAADSMEKITEIALDRLRRLVPCQRTSVELFDFEAQETLLLVVDTDGETRLQEGQRLPLSWSRALDPMERGEDHVIQDLQQVPPSPAIQALREEGIRSTVSLPLRARDRLMGALNLGMKAPGRPTTEQIAVMEDVAHQLAIGICQAQLHEALQEHASQLEQLVATRTAELWASEARFRGVFEQSALGIALLDLQGRVITSNPALQEMLGQSDQTLHGWTFTQFAHPDEKIKPDIRAYRRMREGKQDSHRMELRYVGREGRTGWVNMLLSLVRDAQGEPQFIVAMVEEITERKKTYQALIQSEKLATTGRLAASLGHEINNPLQTVIGCLGLAKETLKGSDACDEAEEYMGMALQEIKRAARIVHRLREVSQPSSPERGEPTDVNDLIDQVLVVSRKNLTNRQIHVIRNLAPDLPRPVILPDRIQQVFLNLVLNASDAMVKGGELSVQTTYDAENDEVIVKFTDQGGGIPDEVMDHLFDPFFSTKPEGTGLGLFVSRSILQEQGGRIEVESVPGVGCTFTVVLPISPPFSRSPSDSS